MVLWAKWPPRPYFGPLNPLNVRDVRDIRGFADVVVEQEGLLKTSQFYEFSRKVLVKLDKDRSAQHEVFGDKFASILPKIW